MRKKLLRLRSQNGHTLLTKARALSVDVPCTLSGKVGVFIDKVITCAAHLGGNLKCIKSALWTVIHAMAHKSNRETYLQRQDYPHTHGSFTKTHKKHVAKKC